MRYITKIHPKLFIDELDALDGIENISKEEKRIARKVKKIESMELDTTLSLDKATKLISEYMNYNEILNENCFPEYTCFNSLSNKKFSKNIIPSYIL